MYRRIGFAILVLLSAVALAPHHLFAAAHEKEPLRHLREGEEYKVFRIDLREDMLGEGMPFFMHRAIVAADAARADAIVLNLHTNGGSLGVMQELRDHLVDVPVPLYAYVNRKAWSAGALLAVISDKIVMAPLSSIGAAQVITAVGSSLDEVVEQKINATLKADIRAAAKYKGHPVLICEAFIDRDIEIPGLTPKGEVLAMDQEQATTETVYVDPKTSETVVLPPLAIFTAENIEDLLQKEGIWPAEILTYEMTWSENVAKWMMGIKAILLLIGVGALFIEMKTPGLGAPAAVGIIALALFFWASYLSDLANFIEPLLFAIGMGLLALEIFVIPGFGVAGVSGVLLIVVSLIMSMMKLPPPNVPDFSVNYKMLTDALWVIVIVFVSAFPFLWFLGKILPSTPLFRHLVLDPAMVAAADRQTKSTQGISLTRDLPDEDLLGKTGEALTDLRPAGTALVEGMRLDVTTQGEYIKQGAQVRVTDIHGNVHTVVEARNGRA